MSMNLPVLPTTVVGSYSMPGWLERLKTEFFARRISRHELDEIHDVAVKAAIKDQEVAGVDIITDGELRHDNMNDYFAERLTGVQTDHTSKKFYYDFYDSVVRGKIPMASLRLTEDFKFLAAFTERATKFCITGPHSLVKRIKDEHYKNEEAFAMDLARVMNMELKELVRAGARNIQIDEPYYSGFPEDIQWGVKDVNTHEIETPEIVAERLRKALKLIPAERIHVLPDCGCLHLPQEVAFAKLKTMVEGTKILRKELGG